VKEAGLSVGQAPGRAVLTAIGTTLGAAALIATLGLTTTISHQVSAEFDALRATEVLLRASDEGTSLSADQSDIDRLQSLSGVVVAGRRRSTPNEVEVRRMLESSSPSTQAPILAADPGALEVMAPTILSGRSYDDFHEDEAAQVVMLSRPVAERLGVGRAGTAVYLGNTPYTVIGIYGDVQRRTEALVSVMMPYSTSTNLETPMSEDVLVETLPGAAQQVAHQAPLAVLPENPTAVAVTAPPDPDTFRRTVEENLTNQTLILSLVAFGIGTVSIANSATANIFSRISEIGLRRALGARPRSIFGQLLAETCALGTVGGVIGALLGTAIVSLVSAWNGWAPILDIRVALAAAAAGSLTGLLAGLVPAVRATRIDPVVALER